MSVVDSAKFLGIFVDSNLKWTLHVESLGKKLASSCYAIRSVSRELNMQSARMAYFSLVESHLRYGLPFWGTGGITQFNTIFSLQKRAIHYLFGLNQRTHCKPYFRKSGILTLPSLFIFETACMIRKHRHLFPPRPDHGYSTRTSDYDIYLPTPSTELARRSVIYLAKKLFNHLPHNLKSVPSYQKFRSLTRSYFIERPLYSVDEFWDT